MTRVIDRLHPASMPGHDRIVVLIRIADPIEAPVVELDAFVAEGLLQCQGLVCTRQRGPVRRRDVGHVASYDATSAAGLVLHHKGRTPGNMLADELCDQPAVGDVSAAR